MVVNPVSNMLYFTDYNADKILVADLNSGAAPTVLVNTGNFDISKPSDLVLSKDGNSIYWTDARNRIVSTSVSTKASSILINQPATKIYLEPTSNDLYYTTGVKVYKTNITTLDTPTLVFTTVSTQTVTGIAVP